MEGSMEPLKPAWSLFERFEPSVSQAFMADRTAGDPSESEEHESARGLREEGPSKAQCQTGLQRSSTGPGACRDGLRLVSMVLMGDVTVGVRRVNGGAQVDARIAQLDALGLEGRASRASMTKECSYLIARFGRNRSERRRVEV